MECSQAIYTIWAIGRERRRSAVQRIARALKFDGGFWNRYVTGGTREDTFNGSFAVRCCQNLMVMMVSSLRTSA